MPSGLKEVNTQWYRCRVTRYNMTQYHRVTSRLVVGVIPSLTFSNFDLQREKRHRTNKKIYTCGSEFDYVIHLQHWDGHTSQQQWSHRAVFICSTHTEQFSILMFFADYQGTREHRLFLCRSLTIDISIWERRKKCISLTEIHMILTVCLCTGSGVVSCSPLQKYWEKKFLPMCTRYGCIISGSYKAAPALTFSWWSLQHSYGSFSLFF